MRLLSPWWLLLLVPVLALAVTYVLQHRRRSRYAVRFAALPMLERLVPRSPGWRRHAPATAMLVAFGLMSLAAARPEVELRLPRDNAVVIVAVDSSLSMAASDVAPSRAEAATDAASEFIDGLPDGYDVGVVTFAGGATALSPPTTDHDGAAGTLSDLGLAGGTAIGEGIFASLQQIAAFEQRTGDDVPAHVVLLSDGENTAGRSPAEAAQAAADAGVPVSTIAFGTPDGTVSSGGREIATSIDTEALAQIADGTGGTAYAAEDGDELEQVYDDIDSTIGWRTEPREVTPFAIALALLAGLSAAAMSLHWFARLP